MGLIVNLIVVLAVLKFLHVVAEILDILDKIEAGRRLMNDNEVELPKIEIRMLEAIEYEEEKEKDIRIHCKYYSGSLTLKCSVNPTISCVDCWEFENIAKSSDRTD